MVTLGRSRVAGSIDEFLAGATERKPFRTDSATSGARFEHVQIDGKRLVVKAMHVDDDWIARSLGDVGCWQVRSWESGLLDGRRDVDHAIVAAARGFGRNGWGAALLMRDVSADLVASARTPIAMEQHAMFIRHMATLSASFWCWEDDVGLMPPTTRWALMSDETVASRHACGDPIADLAVRGWQAFDQRAPSEVTEIVADLRRAPWVLAEALAATPWTYLHGDWKMGNLGTDAGGRTILLDGFPGSGPACHDLAWYLVLNRERLPEPKESVIARFHAELERAGVDTSGWWRRQLELCLLGATVQFGWEKALGDEAELAWWIGQAAKGGCWL